MFRHVAVFRLREQTSAEERDRLVAAIRRLPDVVPGIDVLTVGADAGLAAGNADVVVVADFASQQDYEYYASHPEHQRVIADCLRPILAERMAIQYEL